MKTVEQIAQDSNDTTLKVIFALPNEATHSEIAPVTDLSISDKDLLEVPQNATHFFSIWSVGGGLPESGSSGWVRYYLDEKQDAAIVYVQNVPNMPDPSGV